MLFSPQGRGKEARIQKGLSTNPAVRRKLCQPCGPHNGHDFFRAVSFALNGFTKDNELGTSTEKIIFVDKFEFGSFC